MATFYWGLIAIALCIVAAGSIIAVLISVLKKKPKIEWLLGFVIVISTIVSFVIYYYLRIIESGGNLSDWRVVFVIMAYIVSLLIGITFIFHGRKRFTK